LRTLMEDALPNIRNMLSVLYREAPIVNHGPSSVKRKNSGQ